MKFLFAAVIAFTFFLAAFLLLDAVIFNAQGLSFIFRG